MREEGTGHWIFDNGVIENIGNDAANLGVGTVTNGVIAPIHDRKGLVMHCKGGEAGKSCFTSHDATKTPCLS